MIDLDDGTIALRRTEPLMQIHAKGWISPSPPPFLIVTAAHYQGDLKAAREKEYIYGFDYVTSHGFAAAIVVSETA